MSEPTTRRDLAAIARRWIEEVWRPNDAPPFEELHAPGFRDRGAPSGRGTDRDAYAASIAELFAAFPDFIASVDDLVVDPEAGSVGVRWSASGTHRGVFEGIAPSGRTVAFRGIEIIRVRDGRIVERWGEWDGIDLLRQLRGAAPARGEG